MKNPLVLLWGILLIAFSMGFCSVGWPNEPAGATVVSDCPFSGSICPTMFNVYKSGHFIVDPTAPTGGTNQVLDDYMPAGTSVGSGSGQWGANFSPNAREVYTGAWWKTNADFEGSHNNANKLWYVGGAPGNNSMLMWNGIMGLGTPRLVQFCFQTVENNCHVPGFSGDCWTPTYPSGSGSLAANVNAAAATVKPGSGWHQLELYQKASTSSTSKDGIVRWWVDGVLCGNYTTLNYSPGGFDNVQINHAWDGSHVRNQSLEWHHYWDQMRFSIPNGAPSILMITSGLLPAGKTGAPYSATLTASDGKAPFNWFLESGSLPAGLTLNAGTGIISGSPTQIGKSTFTIRVTDASQPALTTSKSFYIITTGTNAVTTPASANDASSLLVSANSGKVKFSLPQNGSGNYRLSIFNLAGKNVYEHKASAGTRNELNLEAALKNGIYFARLIQGQQVSTVRFNVMN